MYTRVAFYITLAEGYFRHDHTRYLAQHIGKYNQSVHNVLHVVLENVLTLLVNFCVG
jgi:hypothetical protein